MRSFTPTLRSSSDLIIGSPHAGYTIKWSQLRKPHQGCAFENITVSGGQFISAGASFLVGRKDKPIYIRARDDYISQLRWLSKKFVILYDVGDRRAWMIDGVSALLHLVRASLRHDQDDEFNDLFLFDPKDLEEAGPNRTGKVAAISVLTNHYNREIRLHQKPDESYDEETTRPGEGSERVKKRKVTYYCLKDRVDHIYHILEQIVTHQSQVDCQDGVGFKVKVSSRRQLEGFDFMDIASDEDPLRPRVTTLDHKGMGWVDFARAIHAITLFGRGFGDLFKPSSDSQICSHWATVPRGLDYLAVTSTDLKDILKKKGCTTTNPWALVDDIHWHNPETIFGPCKSPGGSNARVCCDRVQVLLPSRFPSLWARKYRSPTHLEDAGAVIFGHNRKLPLRWSDSGEPEDDSIEENELLASNPNHLVASPDSGIGSSIGSLPSNGSASQLSTTSPASQRTSPQDNNGWLFRSGRRKKQRVGTDSLNNGRT